MFYHNEVLLPNVALWPRTLFLIIKEDKKGGAGGTYREEKSLYMLLVGKTERKRQDLRVDGRIILKCILPKNHDFCGLDISG